MAGTNRIRVFISDYWKRGGEGSDDALLAALSQAEDVELVNVEPAAWNPVDIRMPGIVRTEIERRVRGSDVVLAMASFHTRHDREWAAFELHVASLSGKPVVAIAPARVASVPRIYVDHPDAQVVESSLETVLSALRRSANAPRPAPSQALGLSRAALWEAVERRRGGLVAAPRAAPTAAPPHDAPRPLGWFQRVLARLPFSLFHAPSRGSA